MDAANQENRRDLASRILRSWGLSGEQRDQLLGGQERVNAVISIWESLHVILSEDEDRSTSWISRPNEAFGGKSALEIIQNGEIEQVQTYLKYHAYSA